MDDRERWNAREASRVNIGVGRPSPCRRASTLSTPDNPVGRCCHRTADSRPFAPPPIGVRRDLTVEGRRAVTSSVGEKVWRR